MTTTTITKREQAISDWEDLCRIEWQRAEEATAGNLIARDRRAEFERMYGGFSATSYVMFQGGNSTHACYWATEELLNYWERQPRTLWCQFAKQAGIATPRERQLARQAGLNQSQAVHEALRKLQARRR